MPRIRNFQWSYETVTTDAGLTITTPINSANDLLLAIIQADTGSQTIACSGWTVLFSQTNTTHLSVLYKISSGSEASSFTFTGTVNETFNGCIISIEDVNTTNPFGSTPLYDVQNQAASSRFLMQQITTTVANSLLIYGTALGGSTGAPNFHESIVQTIIANDGAAESLGVGWSFKPTTGLTSSTVYASNTSNITAAGVRFLIQIAPPSGGATVIPTFISDDQSAYLDPINGTTAYNGNTAAGATADTNFSTTLGSFTASDAAIANDSDRGINPFHSCIRLTTASGGTNLSGAELVFSASNRPNVSAKNVLIHYGPTTEGQVQRLDSIGSGKGVWFGMRSSNGSNWKIWQVGGSDLGPQRHRACVINSSASNTVSTNGTLDPTAIYAFGFWISATGIPSTTVAYNFAMLWMIDTTTFCGGNSSYPVDLKNIYNCISSKERFSLTLQGSNQVLSYQPIQFGNGGTCPLYLNLESTAIEFPTLYNQSQNEVVYNSIENYSGITYYAGSSDTVIHKNAVISSKSKYHWRIHSSSSASASYDFSGLSVIGAGDVQLRNVTTFTEILFSKCDTVFQNSATITNCTFSKSIGTSALSSDDLSKISYSSFVSSGTGHAIVITVAGTYTFTANQFSGYASSNGSTGNEAIYNNSGGSVTINITGGGSTPSIRNGTSASTTVNTSASVTLTGLQSGSEVRFYLGTDPSTATEIGGIETSSTTFSFTQSYATQSGYLRIMATGYQEYYLSLTYSSSDVSIPISQVIDRNYQE